MTLAKPVKKNNGANLGPQHGDTFHNDLHKDLKADLTLASAQFNPSVAIGVRPFSVEKGLTPSGLGRTAAALAMTDESGMHPPGRPRNKKPRLSAGESRGFQRDRFINPE